jgi:mercuric ion transport protein
MKTYLEKIGGVGAVVAAAACPICFPKLALIGAFLGLGALSAYESQFLIAAQVLVALALVGHFLSYRRHRNRWLLGFAILSVAAVFGGLYVAGSEMLIYIGLVGLLASSATDFWRRFRSKGATPVITR